MGNEQSTHKPNGLQTKVEDATLQHQNGGLNGHTVKILENNVVSEVAEQNSCEAPTLSPSLDVALDQTDDSSPPVPEESPCLPENVQQKQETSAESEVPSPALTKKDPTETAEKVNFFGKLFKKKTESPSIAENLKEPKIHAENPSSPVADDPQSDLLNRLADASILCEAEPSIQSKSKRSKVEYALQLVAETPPSGSDPEPADRNTRLAFEVGDYVDASGACAVPSAVVVVERKVKEAGAELEASASTAWAVVEAVDVKMTSSGVMEVTEENIKDGRAAAENEEAEVKVEKTIAGAQAIVGPVVEAETEVEAMTVKAEDKPKPEMEKRAQLSKSDTGMDPGSTEEPDLTSPPSIAQESKSQEDSRAAMKLNNDGSKELAEPKEDSVTFKEPNCVSVTPTPEESTAPETGEDQKDQLVETLEGESTEDKTVMNFFKTLVNPTKTPKKEKASPDVAIDPKETPPAPTTAAAHVVDAPASTAAKGMSIPPPPPPEPPKLESKGETAAKPVKSITKEEPKDAAKEPESAKAKSSKDSPFSILFRSKASKAKGATSSGAKDPVKPSALTPEVVPQTIDVQKVDASKASTLEAAAKPEPPPAPEERKTPAKASSFRSLLKPSKALLDQMASKVQTASASGVRLLMKTTGGAAEPKKEPSAPPAEPEAAQAVKTKEDPKAAPKAPASEAPVENQSGIPQSGEDPVNIPRKMEKRNSIHLFFKNLGKRHSDTGVQTEPAVSSASEKAK